MNNRLEKLLEFLKDDPHDPFTLYAIATEYVKTDAETAKQYFDQLLHEHEEYVPTYYHAAHLFTELDLIERAGEVYKKGIIQAEKQQDSLALRELKNAYQNFLFEYDDE